MTERITTPFGFESTATEVIEGIDLHDRQAIVTGASSGIGIETARALAQAGATVTLAVRNTEAGDLVAADIRHSTGNPNVLASTLDLVDLRSIERFIGNWDGPLHILVNNAGVMAIPTLELSPEGHEMHFAINHLGHFKLAFGLHDALKAAGNARVVSLSSRGHLEAPVDFDDIDFRSRPYDPVIAYGQSKTATALFAVEAARLWKGDGITANAVHPGAIIDTNLTRNYDAETVANFRTSGAFVFKTPEQGAATSVLVATWPPLEGIGGRYFENCNEAAVDDPSATGTDGAGVAAYALDLRNARRLWEVSLDMTTSAA